MTDFTLDDLKRVMRECAGEDESVDLDGDILDSPFEDLGYDSLALLETATRIERERGVSVPEEMLSGAKTPRLLLDAVNSTR
ncbi:acyl carrier protein [Streptomyces sp. ISL-98]|uniref:acyl carrier protein n=1 Tax=Streptomyces sp. ISL-98 TaxID=2819192 RepID=UPI001BEABDF2|nr:acyl carrier protein [Streptomyces sp. ISL-98]MBT2511512.1 acyl carrier protein [Streptomyces sp. ISL-98]